MTQAYPLNHGDVAIEPFFDVLQEFQSGAAPHIVLSLVSANPITTVQAIAGTGHDQQSVSLSGRYRYLTGTASAPHPGGAAGTYDVYATGSDNNVALGGGPGGSTLDNTVYAFALQIRAQGSPPATALYRKIGEVDWSGTAITTLRQQVGQRRDGAPVHAIAPLAAITPLRVRGAASQTAPLAVFENSALTTVVSIDPSGTITFAGDTNLYRAAAKTLATDGDLSARPNGLTTGDVRANEGLATQTVIGDDLGTGKPSIVFGSAEDTNLYRAGANSLATDDAFTVGGSLNLSGTFFNLTSGGDINWNGDTNLYRGAADILQTDDHLYAVRNLVSNLNTAAQVRVGSYGGSVPIIYFGSAEDTNLYRYGADTLKTDGSLFVSPSGDGYGVLMTVQSGNLAFGARVSGDTQDRLNFDASATKLNFGPGGSTAADTNLYRSGADTLKTDDSLVVAAGFIAREGQPQQFKVDGTGIGFFNHSTAALSPAYSLTNPATQRSLDQSAGTLTDVLHVLGTLIADLKSYGLIG